MWGSWGSMSIIKKTLPVMNGSNARLMAPSVFFFSADIVSVGALLPSVELFSTRDDFTEKRIFVFVHCCGLFENRGNIFY